MLLSSFCSDNMKMNKIIPIVLFAIFAFCSCSAELVDTLPKEEVHQSSVVELVGVTSQSATIRFKPVAYAKRYAYQVDGDVIDATVRYQDGFNYITIQDGLNIHGTVSLYASTDAVSVQKPEWIKVGSAEYTLTLEDTAPDAYLSARYADSAIIGIYSVLTEGSVDYTGWVVSDSSDFSTTIETSSGIIEINDLSDQESYTVTLFQTLSGSGSISSPSTISIPAYDPEQEPQMNIGVDDTGFSVSNASGHVSLYKKTDIGTEVLVMEDVVVQSDGTAHVEFSDLPSLFSGDFFFKSDNELSNILRYTVPLSPRSLKNNFKSAFVYFVFAESVTSDFTLSITGVPGAEIRFLDENTVCVSGLDSNMSEPQTVTILMTNRQSGNVYSCDVEVETESFAGRTFEWRGQLKGGINPSTSFIIDVKDAADGSDFPYYVYFNKTDPVAGGSSDFRIMPLRDDSPGLTSPDISVDLQNAAYRKNSDKWNSLRGLMTPEDWRIAVPDADLQEKDIVVTQTESYVSIMNLGWVGTETTFEFDERILENGNEFYAEPYVKFKNIGLDAPVVMGLYQNASPQYSEFDNDSVNASYSWYLTPVESN